MADLIMIPMLDNTITARSLLLLNIRLHSVYFLKNRTYIGKKKATLYHFVTDNYIY